MVRGTEYQVNDLEHYMPLTSAAEALKGKAPPSVCRGLRDKMLSINEADGSEYYAKVL